jgi:hypothetical protein
MSRTHVFLRCMHPDLESARKETWELPDEDGRIARRPTSVGQLLGKAKWEKPLADWILAIGVGYLGMQTGFRSRTGGEERWMATGAICLE